MPDRPATARSPVDSVAPAAGAIDVGIVHRDAGCLQLIEDRSPNVDALGASPPPLTQALPEHRWLAYRQPSSGATNLRMLSMAWALYSTPSWFGTVSSSVSAAWIAVSWASCLTRTSGSAA